MVVKEKNCIVSFIKHIIAKFPLFNYGNIAKKANISRNCRFFSRKILQFFLISFAKMYFREKVCEIRKKIYRNSATLILTNESFKFQV